MLFNTKKAGGVVVAVAAVMVLVVVMVSWTCKMVVRNFMQFLFVACFNSHV
jgi:hypothetical protein